MCTMNDKITMQELIDLFAAKSGLTLKDADLFVRTFFEQIEEVLATEKYVKIKGLGTFKLTEVDSRESINVNTGERIEIQGHTKVSFVPDSGLKEIINKPFAHFETVILNEGTQLDDTPIITEEEKAIEDEYNAPDDKDVATVVLQTSVEETKKVAETVSVTEKSKEPPSETQEAKPATRVAIQVEKAEPSSSAEAQQSRAEEPAADAESATVAESAVGAQSTVASQTENASQPSVGSQAAASQPATIDASSAEKAGEAQQEQDHESAQATPHYATPALEDAEVSSHRWKMVSIVLAVVLVIVMVCAYLFYRKVQNDQERLIKEAKSMVIESSEKKMQKADTLSMKNINLDTEQTLPAAAGEQHTEAAAGEEQPAKATSTPAEENPIKVQKLNPDVEYKIVGTQGVHRLKPGESLVKIAARYYGAKDFWTYICKHNSDVIKDADRVPIGTDLNIPILTPIP